MNKIYEVYNLLYSSFGKQGWWPLTIKGFESKHHAGRPKNSKHRFEIIVGAILTQNTNWKNAEKALYNLSKAGMLDGEKIAKADKKKINETDVYEVRSVIDKEKNAKFISGFLERMSKEK